MDLYKKPWDGPHMPVMRVTPQPDGSYDVRRAVETAGGKLIHLIAEDHFASAADLPEWVPPELRGGR